MILRTVFFYIVLMVHIRIMGKRQLGQMEPIEFVVTMLIANLATIPLENPEHSIRAGLIPMIVILIFERLLSWGSLKSTRLRRILCGKPVILIENGRLLRENLRRTRITLDELSRHLREQGILEIQTVQYAILETNGSITVFPFPAFSPASAKDAGVNASNQELPWTVVSDGAIRSENLKAFNKSPLWLPLFLKQNRCSLSDVVLLTVTNSGKTHLIRRDPSPSDSRNH